ncbi:cysteine-rich protein 3 [Petaurus breviceps papuanus]|uniref:cysteine-rich protein 3 n=1 Tax=Petaurus breviceps papuanus TaxID=3040969 RepID=UPI0036DEEE28
MSWTCPRCQQPVFFAEKVSSLGQNWHRFCLKCERCHNVLAAGGHAEHNGKPYCHKPCYAVLFGPQGIKIGGVGSYMEDPPRPPTPITAMPLTAGSFSPPRSRTGLPQAKRARRSKCPFGVSGVYSIRKTLPITQVLAPSGVAGNSELLGKDR